MTSLHEKLAANTGVPPSASQGLASPGAGYGLGVKPRLEGGGWPPSTNPASSTLFPIGQELMPGEKIDQSPYPVQSPSGGLADAEGARAALSQYQKTPQSPVQDIPQQIPQQIPPQSPVQGIPQQTAMQQALPAMKTTIASDITESKLRNLVAKYAAQDNSANSRSAVGESGGLTYKTDEEDHATGAVAWESLGKYMKTAGDDEKDKDRHLGSLEGSYVTDVVGADAQIRAADVARTKGDLSQGKFFRDLASVNRAVQERKRRANARFADSRKARMINLFDPSKFITDDPDITLTGLTMAMSKKDEGKEEKAREKYESKIKKHQEKVDPKAEKTKRETPWHISQQGQLADLDADVAGHTYARREGSPLSYWLNPLARTGPLSELNDRSMRRLVASVARPDSTAGRAAMGAGNVGTLGLLGMIAGNEKAQQSLRRSAMENKIFNPDKKQEENKQEESKQEENKSKEEEEKEVKELAKAAAEKFGKTIDFSGDLVKRSVHVEKGGPISRWTGATLGRLNPINLLNLILSRRAYHNPEVGDRFEKHKELAEAIERGAPKGSLKDTVVRLGGGNIIDDLIWKKERGKSLPWYSQIGGRVGHNKRSGPLGKILGYLTNSIQSLNAPLSRGAYYDPQADAVSNYIDERAITGHELGHAIDFNTVGGETVGQKDDKTGKVPHTFGKRLGKGVLRDLYMLAYGVPASLVPGGGATKLWHEAQANIESRDALIKAFKDNPKKLRELIKERAKVLPAGYGSYIGGAIPFGSIPIPGGGSIGPGPILGMIAGRLAGEQAADDPEYIESVMRGGKEAPANEPKGLGQLAKAANDRGLIMNDAKFRNLMNKHAEQDNSTDSRSAVGESKITYKTNEDDHATGTKAWDSLSTYMKTGADETFEVPDGVKLACDKTGLTPYQYGFAVRVHQAHLSPQQIREGIEKAAEYMGDEYVEELREGMDKIAFGLGAAGAAAKVPGWISSGAKLIPRGYKWTKNLLGYGTKAMSPKDMKNLADAGKKTTETLKPKVNMESILRRNPATSTPKTTGLGTRRPDGSYTASGLSAAEKARRAAATSASKTTSTAAPAASTASTASKTVPPMAGWKDKVFRSGGNVLRTAAGAHTGHLATGQGENAMPWYIKYPAMAAGGLTGAKMPSLQKSSPALHGLARRMFARGEAGMFAEQAAPYAGIEISPGLASQVGIVSALLPKPFERTFTRPVSQWAKKHPLVATGATVAPVSYLFGQHGARTGIQKAIQNAVAEIAPDFTDPAKHGDLVKTIKSVGEFVQDPRAMEIINDPDKREKLLNLISTSAEGGGFMASLEGLGNMLDPILSQLIGEEGAEAMHPLMKVLLLVGTGTAIGGLFSGSKGAGVGGLAMMALPFISNILRQKQHPTTRTETQPLEADEQKTRPIVDPSAAAAEAEENRVEAENATDPNTPAGSPPVQPTPSTPPTDEITHQHRLQQRSGIV